MNKQKLKEKLIKILEGYLPCVVEDDGTEHLEYPEYFDDEVDEIMSLLEEVETKTRHEVDESWINQPANEHDNRIRREATLECYQFFFDKIIEGENHFPNNKDFVVEVNTNEIKEWLKSVISSEPTDWDKSEYELYRNERHI